MGQGQWTKFKVVKNHKCSQFCLIYLQCEIIGSCEVSQTRIEKTVLLIIMSIKPHIKYLLSVIKLITFPKVNQFFYKRPDLISDHTFCIESI